MLFRVFKTDIPGFDSSFRLSTFSTDFSTINTDFPQSRLKGQVLKNCFGIGGFRLFHRFNVAYYYDYQSI